MKSSNFEVIDELKLVLKRMDRLREGFRLEKDSVLMNTDTGELEKLRERSRSMYQMEMAEYQRDIGSLKRSITSDQPGMEEAEDLSELCAKEAASLLAHLVSTPNRLLRIYKAGGLRGKEGDS